MNFMSQRTQEIEGRYYYEKVRIVKQPERVKTPDDYQREHEIALLKLIAAKYPNIVRELVSVMVK